MGKLNIKFVSVAAATMLVSSSAWAVTFGTSTDSLASCQAMGLADCSLQSILDNIAVDGSIDLNTSTDHLDDLGDSFWQVSGQGLSSATMVIEIAGNASTNSFGVYQGSKKVTLFSGAAGQGDKTTLSLVDNGTNYDVYTTFWDWNGSSYSISGGDTGVDFDQNMFGFFMDAASGDSFYSDTNKNSDGFDHMLAYAGTGEQVDLPGTAPGAWSEDEFILAWEDVSGGGDQDYNDMVIMIESIFPVPAPATLALVGLGLLGMGYRTRRNRA